MVVVYNKAVKDKKAPKPTIIGRGVVTKRATDGTRYLNEDGITVNCTPSRKEVQFHQLMSRETVIPFIKNYYIEGKKFLDTFNDASCFVCLIAESHLAIDESTNEEEDNDVNNVSQAAEEEDSVAESPHTTPLLWIGTDAEVKALKELATKTIETLYVSRDDERLGLSEDHEDYSLENED